MAEGGTWVERDTRRDNSLSATGGEGPAAAEVFVLGTERRYQRLGALGRGGMGAVTRVRDLELGRLAALKELHGEVDELARERFLREAKITARLDHPGIPPVYEAGERTDGQLYLVLRLIEGETLQQAIFDYHAEGRDPAELRRLLRVIIKVAEALAHAHSRGILHRDLKPTNVMVGRYGEVLLMDWGVAKDLDAPEERLARIAQAALSDSNVEAVGLTEAGSILGTLGYMAPEQAEGEEVSARSDVFSLGVMLTELLSGSGKLRASSLELFRMTVEGRHPRPRDILPEVPWELDEIAAQALAFDAASRTASAEAVAAQLEAWLEGHEVPGIAYGLGARWRRKVARNPGLVTSAMGGLIAAGLLVGLWGQVQSQRRRAAEDELRLARSEAQRQELEAVARAEREQAAAAQREAESAKAVLASFQEARRLLARGAPAGDVSALIARALAASGRDYEPLLEAARLYGEGGLAAQQRAALLEAEQRFPPAYEALYELHSLELGGGEVFQVTAPLRRLIDTSQARGDRNEFALCAEADALVVSGGDLEAALALYDEAELSNRRLPWLYHNRGVVKSRLRRPEDALRDLDRAIALQPSSLAHHSRGMSHEVLGHLAEARADFNAAIILDDRNSEAWFARGNLSYAQGQLEAAIEDWREALERRPGDARVLTNLGNALSDLGRFEESQVAIEAALEANPNHETALLARGTLAQARGDAEGALAAYEALLERNPASLAARGNRAAILGWMGRVEEAIAELGEVISRDPTDLVARANRARLNSDEGNDEAAWEDVTAILSIAPDHPAATFTKAIVLERRGELEASAATYARAAELDPENAHACLYLGYVRLNLNDVEAAMAAYDEALRRDPALVRALVSRGALRAQRDDSAGANADFAEALRLDPKSYEAHFERGSLRLKEGDVVAGEEDINAAIALLPTYTAALTHRAVIRASREEYDAALEDLRVALESDPEDFDARLNLGLLHYHRDEPEAALAELRRAVALVPEHPMVERVAPLMAKLASQLEGAAPPDEAAPDEAE